jgi:phage tail-like protein
LASQASSSSPQFSLIRGSDQWQRAHYEQAALVAGIVQLAWSVPQASANPAEVPALGAGLAFDGHCRLYHSLPDAGTVERILWSAEDPLRPGASPTAVQLFERDSLPLPGDFSRRGDEAGPLARPRGLAVDDDDRLFIAEAGIRSGHSTTTTGSVLVFDLWSRRLLRRVRLSGAPLDLAAHGRQVYALLEGPPALARLTARGTPQVRRLPASITLPGRLARAPDGRLLVLEHAGNAAARIVDAGSGAVVLDGAVCSFATDLEFYRPHADEPPVLVLARGPAADFLRFHVEGATLEQLAPLTARAYDGLGIVRTPDERIAYWTAHGLRYAVAARVRYEREGRVIGFRLDSGEYQTTWGRLFIDACIPRDTQIRVRCLSADEPPETGLIARSKPVNVQTLTIAHDDLSPPMPPLWMVDAPPAQPLPLHRRATGPELPWLRRAADDEFETYEAPVHAPPGRYLWVIFELTGNSQTTPRIRALRAEHPGHDLLRRIPRTLSSEPQAAEFLQRYLSLFAGALSDLDRRAALRQVLLDPRAAPQEVLPWLAGFVGLVLDERWSVEARRAAIREAVWLFRFRGTIKGLSRFIEILMGVRPIFIEKFRLRGGGVIGEPVARSSRAILGAGLRVGGSVGTPDDTGLTADAADAFETHAHRFTVLLPGLLGEEELDVVADLLEAHRPAHTLYDLCTLGAGMRVGRGLHVGLTSAIGRSSGFSTLQLGRSALGRGAVVGRPQPGTRVGATRLPGTRGDAVLRGDTRVG